ncbi:K02A2.6-like [Cordylochernes scorpioides]|uniref:K02A2.6-like n=1 Tax=Cordylochernes scorpioides TaxID=51811 RepID=A0ABY6LWS3_9ARAC|nr:K02A2.6-like [Cordylochernes scorpioides]
MEDHDEKLNQVLSRLRDINLVLNNANSIYRQKSLKLLRYIIDDKGIHLDLDLMKPLFDDPPPKDKTRQNHDKSLKSIRVPLAPVETPSNPWNKLGSDISSIREIVTDNGTPFIYEEFVNIPVSKGIKHIRTANYHPACNGEVENLNKTPLRSKHIQHCSMEIL